MPFLLLCELRAAADSIKDRCQVARERCLPTTEFEERAARFFLAVRHAGERFLEALHEPTQARQPLPRPRDPGRILKPAEDPSLAHRQWLPILIARRKQPPPPPDNILIRPPRNHVRIEPQQNMQVVVEHRKPSHGNREYFRKFPEPALDPLFAVRPSLCEQMRASDAPRTQ
jgi:hypothetical protein